MIRYFKEKFKVKQKDVHIEALNQMRKEDEAFRKKELSLEPVPELNLLEKEPEAGPSSEFCEAFLDKEKKSKKLGIARRKWARL